jgi:hypothetical protein
MSCYEGSALSLKSPDGLSHSELNAQFCSFASGDGVNNLTSSPRSTFVPLTSPRMAICAATNTLRIGGNGFTECGGDTSNPNVCQMYAAYSMHDSGTETEV